MVFFHFIVYLFAVVYHTESILPQGTPEIIKRHNVGNKSNSVEDNLGQKSIPFIKLKPKVEVNEESKAALNPLNQSSSSISNVQEHKSVSTISSLSSNKTTNVNVQPMAGGKLEEKTFEFEPGAITRGILVLVGVSFLFILYVGFRTYKKKKKDKRRTLVRKYGVRTRKSDLEMEPLPLSDDDEDETLFDLTVNGSAHH